jgi:hypothetical protein
VADFDLILRMYQGIVCINRNADQITQNHVNIMKTSMLCALSLAATVSFAWADSRADLDKAIKELGGKANYAWKSTVTVPEGTQFRMGPTEGQCEKGGLTHVTMSFGDNKTQMVLQGEKAAMLTQDGEWKSAEELSNSEGPGRFVGMMARSFKAPTAQAADLAGYVKELKQDGDVLSGDLSEEGAKQMLMFRRGGSDGPTVTNPKGSAKFWMKDGVLSKYEFHVEGTVSFNGNDREVNRTTTVEIKDVGTTKVQVPDEAKKKLS